ncbi:hypothetical protein [Micromonospora chersina]|uniref:hypothetical protein n=1 Tax=Micromonospora chersina TaxID=47854 RepID=UPI003711B6A8
MRWIQFGARGWVRVNGLDDEVVAYAHTFEQEGRRVIGKLLVSAQPWPPGVTSGTLKGFPIGWVESVVNTPEALKALSELDDADPKNDPVRVAVDEMGKGFLFEERPYVTDEVPRLSRPDGRDPDAFYRQVAEAYSAAVSKSRKVAPVLAEQAGVPVPTVHRWVAEARRRGFLPPARKGRAG